MTSGSGSDRMIVPRPDDEPAPADAGAAQAEVAQLRATVLGGRGPGASTAEFLQSTRARVQVGGEPVTERRERVARAAAGARRDVDTLALEVAADRSRLSGSVGAVRARLEPREVGGRVRTRLARWGRRRPVQLTALALGAALLLRRRRPGRR